MNDSIMDTIAKQIEVVRADERAHVVDMLQQLIDELKMKGVGAPAAIPQPTAEPTKPKRGRKAKAAPYFREAKTDNAVFDALQGWSNPERPTATDLAKELGRTVPEVSASLRAMLDTGQIKGIGNGRGKRYLIPINAARNNSDHAEA